MFSFRNIALIFVLSTLLSACSSAESERETVQVYDSRWSEGMHTDVSSVASYIGGEGIEVYSLDQPAAHGVRNEMAPALVLNAPQSMAGAQDSSVTVYPFADGLTPVYQGGVPPILPPSRAMPPMNSPFPLDVKSMPTPPPVLQAPSLSKSGEVSSIYFPHNITRVSAADKGKLKQIAYHYAGNKKSVLMVEGHASTKAYIDDPVERRIANLKVSMKRAVNVSQALIRDGVPAAVIKTVAIGDVYPARARYGMTSEQASRRVDVYNLKSF